MDAKQFAGGQRGFTLVEVMIVVGILGVLAAMAIPAYQAYSVRSQVTEGLEIASSAKTSVAEYFAQHGEWPGSNADVGLGAPEEINGAYVTQVRIAGGGIEVTYGHDANRIVLASRTVSLVPGLNPNGDILWRCGTAADPAAWSEIIDTGAVTSVESKDLPQDCR